MIWIPLRADPAVGVLIRYTSAMLGPVGARVTKVSYGEARMTIVEPVEFGGRERTASFTWLRTHGAKIAMPLCPKEAL